MPAADRQIWLAGGIGVTPFLSLARSLPDEGGPSVDLYYGVEHEEEAHFLDELREIAARRGDFRVVVVPRDRDGFLTAERLVEELGDLSRTDVLICGPPAMIHNLRAQLHAVGVPDARIDAEEFDFAKVGVDRVAEPRLSDGQVLALLFGSAFAGLLFAAAIVAVTEAG